MPQDTRPGPADRQPPVPRAAPAPETVELTIPADRDRVVLVRAVAGHIASGLGLSVAQLTDLRLAVDEACGLFLAGPRRPNPGGHLTCRFEERPGALTISVTGAVGGRGEPDRDDIGWIMLEALVDEISWTVRQDVGTVRLVTLLRGDDG